MSARDPHRSAAEIIREAGGKLVGRTRLQKVAYLKQLAGFGPEFEFEYRHYGPYSEDLASSIYIAEIFDLVKEEERPTEWGGWYSVFTFTGPERSEDVGDERAREFVTTAARIGAVELELAATAAFLYSEEGIGRVRPGDPWKETAARKPDKAAGGRLERAKIAYQKLRDLATPQSLPKLQST